ncbi:MAG: type II toxin-antitoxin system VapC family toxin [Desulfobacula sp.]|uniref:type II toxin-antitoxin system VapC family toxin n=1 Tax=Desulfobacula sp. TaxID=2593537 RepID=UPI0025C18AAE|nr:type II toxin-antitoxin system VapC family toxin [Desulfobacula sp.]MCD4722803.1 type II toxin-antitoxin system VapC family toxin [Desulfobacula sp.]
MNILLDTHVLIWALENNPALSKIAATSIIDPENMVFVSAASVWEIGIKKNLGKLETPDNLIEEIKLHRFTPLSINFDHAQLAGTLPNIHKDPFDRILIAQAITEKLILVTRDELMARYKVQTLKA